MTDAGNESNRDPGTRIEITLNGEERRLTVSPNTTLVTLLREELSLKGTVEGCGVGVCGCCTVLVDGEPNTSCLQLAVNTDGSEVETVDGMSERHSGDGLHPLQQSFLESDSFQCGYCTPGMLMGAEALLRDESNPDEEDIKTYLSENICRCTGYESIIEAVKAGASELEE